MEYLSIVRRVVALKDRDRERNNVELSICFFRFLGPDIIKEILLRRNICISLKVTCHSNVVQKAKKFITKQMKNKPYK